MNRLFIRSVWVISLLHVKCDCCRRRNISNLIKMISDFKMAHECWRSGFILFSSGPRMRRVQFNLTYFSQKLDFSQLWKKQCDNENLMYHTRHHKCYDASGRVRCSKRSAALTGQTPSIHWSFVSSDCLLRLCCRNLCERLQFFFSQRLLISVT